MENKFPTGWYIVGFSDDIKKGQVKTYKYFSQDFVLFRGEDGLLNALEPHCPHLGAHLGYGGKVFKNQIQCPFHAWRFAGNGELENIPYCKELPQNAKIDTWPLQEHQGLIFIFYSKERCVPPYKMPKLPFLDNQKWKFRSRIKLNIKGRIQDSKENPPDFIHFPSVHKLTDKSKIEELQISNWKEDGHYLNYTLNLPYKLMGTSGTASYHFRYFCQTYEAVTIHDPFETRILSFSMPIDENSYQFYQIILTKSYPLPFLGKILNMFATRTNLIEFKKDVIIWEKRRRNSNPVLTNLDQQLIDYRKWASQF